MKHAKRKSFIALALLVLFCFLLAGCEEETRGGYHVGVTNATADFYINDFANLFTEEQKAAMMEKAINFSQSTGGIQVVITTVESLDACITDGSKKLSIDQVAYGMYEQYGIGKDDMGVLFLFSVGDRECWLETGRQMQIYITDQRAGELQDEYAMEYFRQDQLAEGIISLQDGIFAEIQSVVPQDWNASQEATNTTEKPTIVPEETTSDATIQKVQEAFEEREASKGKTGIFAAFLALVLGLVVAIKSVFSNEKKFNKKIVALNEQHQEEMQSLQEAYRKEKEEQQQVWAETKQQLSADAKRRKNKVAEAENAAQQTQMGLQKTIRDLEADKIDLTHRLAILQDKFDRAQRLHPEIDFAVEIQKMIEKEFQDEAERTDNVLANTLALLADKENVETFLEAIGYYQNINPEVRKYMKTDISELYQLYNNSKSLQEEFERAEQEKKDRAAAQEVYAELVCVSQQITVGKHDKREALAQACQKYDRLNQAAQGFFPDDSLIRKLRNLLKVAEADERNWKAAKKAENSVQTTVNRVGYHGEEDDLDSLTQAMRTYQRLSSAEKEHFSADLYEKLRKLMNEAQDDKEEQERRRKRQREEAARRAATSSSSSIHHSSSRSSFGGGSHRGFGGRPSSGGAGRKF